VFPQQSVAINPMQAETQATHHAALSRFRFRKAVLKFSASVSKNTVLSPTVV